MDKKRLIQISVLTMAIMGLLLAAWPVYAADIDDALYLADIVAVNSGEEGATNVAVALDINTQALINGEYVTDDLLNTAIQTSGGSDVPYMPGVGDNPWIYWLSSIGAHESKPYLFYCGGPAMQEGFYYFPNDGGMTSDDNASLELGDTFQIEQKGYVDTDAGANKYLVYKDDAIIAYGSGAEEISAGILGGSLTEYSSSSDGEVYASGGSAAAAQGAAGGTVSAGASTFSMGQTVVNSDQDQTATASNRNLYGAGYTRAAERVNGFGGSITSVQWYLKKTGVPTGTSYCKVYRVSDGALLGTIGTLDVSTLGAAYAWVTFNSTPVSVDTATDIYICFEYSGGDAGNLVYFGYKGSDETGWGFYSAYDGSWHDQATYDATFQDITYTAYQVDRGFLFFDTSSIPDGAGISGANLGFYGSTDSSDTDFDITITNGQPTYPHDPLAAGDFDITHYSGSGGTLTTSGFNVAGYNVIPLNATGLTWINDTGTTKLCLVSSRDIAATTPTGDEYVTIYASEQAGTDKDPYLEVSYVTVTVTVTGITSGVRTVRITADGTDLLLEVYDAADVLLDSDTSPLGGASVPDNANDWSFITNGSMPYMEYHKIWVGGTLVQHIVYERDTTFQDQTAYDNDAIPTFITATSDPDVTASFEDFRPITESEYTGGVGGEGTEMLTDIPDQPPELYGEEGEGLGHLPGAEVINTMLDAANIPQDFFWIWLVFGVAALGVIGGYHFIRSSLLFPAIIGFVIILFFALASGGDPIPLWTILPYSVISGGMLVSERVFGW